MAVARVLLLLAVIGCGRVDFDPVGDGGLGDVSGGPQVAALRVLTLGGKGQAQTSTFDAWLPTQVGTVTVIDERTTTLDATLLAGIDLVLVRDQRRVYSAAEAATLFGWAQSGGSVLALGGFHDGTDVSVPNNNSLIVGFQVQLVADNRSGPVTSFTAHPTTTGLTSVKFVGGRSLDLMTTGAQEVAAIGVLSVAAVESPGTGRFFVWGDEWVGNNGTFEMSLTFWLDVLRWLAHAT